MRIEAYGTAGREIGSVMRKQAFGLVNGVEEKPLGTPAAAAQPRGVMMVCQSKIHCPPTLLLLLLQCVGCCHHFNGRWTRDPRQPAPMDWTWIPRVASPPTHLRPGLAAVVAFSNLPLRNGWLSLGRCSSDHVMWLNNLQVASIANVIRPREFGRKWAFSFKSTEARGRVLEFKNGIPTLPQQYQRACFLN